MQAALVEQEVCRQGSAGIAVHGRGMQAGKKGSAGGNE